MQSTSHVYIHTAYMYKREIDISLYQIYSTSFETKLKEDKKKLVND